MKNKNNNNNNNILFNEVPKEMHQFCRKIIDNSKSKKKTVNAIRQFCRYLKNKSNRI